MAWIVTRFPEPTLVESRRSASITVWDTSSEPPEDSGLVYRWNGYAEKDSVHSLLQYVEIHGERLRRKYLEWIHDLGESRIDGKRVIDHLALDDGLSYWWMTLFVEQSPWKSPSIIDAIRLLALEEIIAQHRPDQLRLVSANRYLHEVLDGWCRKLGIVYRLEQPHGRNVRQFSFRGVYRALPQAAQALISLLRYLLTRWPLKRAEKSGWFGGARTLFFCSYFDNIDPKAADTGVFNSYYWEGLFALLRRMGWQSNWLQLFSPCVTVPTPEAATNWAQRFNRHPREQGFHTFPEAYLSWRMVPRVISRWFKLVLVYQRLGEIKHAFCPPGSQFSLWPLMRWEWQASMCGAVSISNLLWIELFDSSLRDLPHQKKGLYLCENQAWERAMVHSWRKYGHGQLIAVAHSTVRFWDLRYFADPRTIGSSGRHAMPQADLTALNGKAAVDAYLSVEYPRQAIAECEALRYGYLNNLPPRHAWRRSKDDAIKLLILGDYIPAGTRKMLELLEAAIRTMSVRVICTVKPHPNCPVDPADYPSLQLNVVVDPLQTILHAFDIAYSGNLTTAAVDAYLSGLPGVVKLDETELNFSPLRGQCGVRFVSAPEELAEALETADQGTAPSPDRNEFFFLDPGLPRWSRLLAN